MTDKRETCARCGRRLACEDTRTTCGDTFECGYRAALRDAAAWRLATAMRAHDATVGTYEERMAAALRAVDALDDVARLTRERDAPPVFVVKAGGAYLGPVFGPAWTDRIEDARAFSREEAERIARGVSGRAVPRK